MKHEDQVAIGRALLRHLDEKTTAMADDVYANGVVMIHGKSGGVKFIGSEGEVLVNRGVLKVMPDGLEKQPLGEKAIKLYESPGHQRDWLNCIKPICDAVAEVLWLTREATEATPQVAQGGMFQHGFDRSDQASLVRVLLPSNGGIFPEISAGQHRFTIRFVRWRGVDARPAQVNQDVRFQLAIC